MDANFQNQLDELRKENEQLRSELHRNDSKQQKKQERRKKTLTWTWRLFTGESLYKSFNNWFSEYHSDNKVSPDTSANLLTSLVKRFVRVRMLSVLLLLFSLIPSLITLFILIKQNDLINTQNSLVEASRKSSYAFQLSNIYDKVDRDGDALKKGTINRIIGITSSLKPYRILEKDGLSEELYSPEKTQLLLFLLNSEVNRKSMDEIYKSADFSNCDLRNANLTGKYLVGINLKNSNLENCELHSSRLDEANLSNTNMKNVRFSNGSANNAIFTDADLTDAKITRVYLNGVNFDSADTDGATIEPKK